VNAAIAARDALLIQDLKAFGQAMIANTEAQRALHVELVGVDATGLIEIAQHQGAFGWKVNGAGGDGGSVTILNETREAKESLEQTDRRVEWQLQGAPYSHQRCRTSGSKAPSEQRAPQVDGSDSITASSRCRPKILRRNRWAESVHVPFGGTQRVRGKGMSGAENNRLEHDVVLPDGLDERSKDSFARTQVVA